MKGKLDYLDVKILDGLGIYGPRDLALLARKIGLNRGTAWKRVKHLTSHHLVKLHANIYHTNLGLRKAVVTAWATPGHEDLLFDCLCVNDFRNFVSRCYGTSEGCFGIYIIPKERTSEFRQFLDEIEKLGLTKKIQVLWSTCFQNVNLTSTWFDSQSEEWIFPWDDWIEELVHEGTELPYTLVDPEDFIIRADEIDLFILEELEADATTSFVDIAKKLNVSRQTIEHHYQNHILRRNLIESFQVTLAPFDRKGLSQPLFFDFRFEDETKMAKFALSLLDKPFVHFLGKILKEKALAGYLHFLSIEDFRAFIRALSKLIRKGFLKEYNYVFIDRETRTRETVRHELFRHGAWIYNHEEHMRKLEDVMKKHNRLATQLYGKGLSQRVLEPFPKQEVVSNQ